VAEIEKVIDEELEKLRTQPVDARELERVKNETRAGFFRSLEPLQGRGERLLAYALYTGDPGFIAKDLARYQAADAASLQKYAAQFLRKENLVLRADLLRPWANWVTPKEERTRRYDTYFFVGALPEGQLADGDNTETDRADWITPQAALDEFADGKTFLLPPTWTQLDSLNGRTAAEVLAVERQIVPVEPHLAANKVTGNWEIEFFNSDRYNAARNRRAPEGYGADTPLT